MQIKLKILKNHADVIYRGWKAAGKTARQEGVRTSIRSKINIFLLYKIVQAMQIISLYKSLSYDSLYNYVQNI